MMHNADDDECAGASDICGQGECVNMGGSFKCVCLPGFDVLVIILHKLNILRLQSLYWDFAGYTLFHW